MRKVLALLVVLAMAVPAMATVNFSIADGGDGVLVISYASDAGELPRGVGLEVTIDGATADGASVLAVDAKFNTYIDYAADAGAAFEVGDGHPLAKADEAGALDAAASVFSISAGVLDQAGEQAAGDEAAELIQIQLAAVDGATEATVTITGDTTRGPASGVVGGDYASNLPISGTVIIPGGVACVRAGDVAEWEAVGSPDSWCAEYQCLGDADGQTELMGKFQRSVGFNDITILLEGFNTAYTDQAWIAADFDRSEELMGKFQRRVGFNDIAVLLQYFNSDIADNCE